MEESHQRIAAKFLILLRKLTKHIRNRKKLINLLLHRVRVMERTPVAAMLEEKVGEMILGAVTLGAVGMI